MNIRGTRTEDKINIEGHGPGGVGGRIEGLTVRFLWEGIILGLIGVLFYMVWTANNERVTFQDDVRKMLVESRANQDTILRTIASVSEEQRATTYVLTLTETERRNLKLVMPPALRDRIK